MRGKSKGRFKTIVERSATINHKKFSLKPSNIKPVSSKITIYENEALNIIAEECGLTKSTLIKIAIATLIERFLNDETKNMKSRLTPGYDIILNRIVNETRKTLDKCIKPSTSS